MPTYQYACTEPECGHAFEQFQSFSDEALSVCPQCEGRLRKVFNAVGVVFKGSGFYRTDSRAAASTGESAGAASGDSGGTSGDAKGGTSTKESGGTSTKDSTASTSSSASTSTPSTPSTSSSAPAGAGAA